jgi:hypothetical protein
MVTSELTDVLLLSKYGELTCAVSSVAGSGAPTQADSSFDSRWSELLLVAGDCSHPGKSFALRFIARAVAWSCTGVAAPAQGATPSEAMLVDTAVRLKAQVSQPFLVMGFPVFQI